MQKQKSNINIIHIFTMYITGTQCDRSLLKKKEVKNVYL